VLFLRPLIDHIQRWISEPPPDHLFEITETCLSAVSPRNPGQTRQEILGERALAASPSAPNLLKPHLFREALPRVTGSAAPKRTATALVIPDYAVRMAILDFEEFPANDAERIPLLRFRLRKSVPFHIDEAQLAYAVQLEEPKRIDVLTIAIARPILDEYERIFTDAGYRVGLVTASSIATLPLCMGGTPGGLTLLAKAAGATLSVLLLEQGRVRLVRCLDLAGSSESEEAEREDRSILALLQQTLAYAEDQIGQSVNRLLLCGFGPETDSLGKLAQREFGVAYSPVRSKFGVASQENAGLLGLLEQYAA
jgi:type IV pilus assembly protein PilM